MFDPPHSSHRKFTSFAVSSRGFPNLEIDQMLVPGWSRAINSSSAIKTTCNPGCTYVGRGYDKTANHTWYQPYYIYLGTGNVTIISTFNGYFLLVAEYLSKPRATFQWGKPPVCIGSFRFVSSDSSWGTVLFFVHFFSTTTFVYNSTLLVKFPIQD